MPVAADIISLDEYRQPKVRVERMPDPHRRNRTAYRITGTSSIDVQQQITGLIAEVEMHGVGYGRFIGPHHIGHGCYVALGEIVLTTKETNR
jgi:hypothetical protein